MSVEMHAVFKGRVQGVGFRWTLADHAQQFQLIGTVQNLANGSVEVYAQGTKEALESFLAAVKRDPGNAHIDSVTCKYYSPNKQFNEFRIIH